MPKIRQCLKKAIEHGPQPAGDLEIFCAVEPYLAETQLDKILPIWSPVDYAPLSRAVLQLLAMKMPPADISQQSFELIDRQNGRGRVVDSLRQRLDADIDDDTEREARILFER